MTSTPLRSLFVPILLLGSIVALSACKRGAPTADMRGAPVTVTTMTLAPAPWQDTLQALGTASANESVVITAKVSETVRKVNFESGDVVQAGALLVDLSGNQQIAGLEEARAAYNEAKRLFERQDELGKRQLVAASQVDAQRAIRDTALARIKVVTAQLGDRAITAPFDGVLGLRQVSPGTLVTPGTPIATLDDISLIKLHFTVPEAMLAQLAVGREITARTSAYPQRSFSGRVTTINTRINPTTRAVTVRADIPNADSALRPGMLMTVQLLQPEREALVVPEIAVVQVGLDSFLFRVRPDASVEQVKVALGARRRGEVELLDKSGNATVEAIQAGDRIVVDGTVKLRNGSRITAVPAADQAPTSAPAH